MARKQPQKVVDLSHSIKRKERSEGHGSISEAETSNEEERSRSRRSGKEGSPTGKLRKIRKKNSEKEEFSA